MKRESFYWVARWDGKVGELQWERVDERELSSKVGFIRAFIARRAFYKYSMVGITLYPFVIVTGTYNPRLFPSLERHELVHLIQQRSEGPALFYLKYFLDWLKHFVRERDVISAYFKIRYEEEARRVASTDESFQEFAREKGFLDIGQV